TLEVAPKEAFPAGDPAFREFCTRFADERFSGGTMSAERLAYLLERETLTHILTFRSGEMPLAYVFTAIEAPLLHYWFAFYDTRYRVSHSLGKWIMWRTLRWARESGLRHVYLGTCYGERSLYKVRDHRGIEWFTGVEWSRDLETLKRLCRLDAEPGDRDLLKPPWTELSRAVFAPVLSRSV
ncbi:MAG TPA: GNAT family N-acetyltransferase, partial [Armatimonadota bacterium]|nr:GNAT family N-acetyltransferase [Armatimonadota bacterium]